MQVHRLAGVHLHHVADAVGQRHGVGRLRRERRAASDLVELARTAPSTPSYRSAEPGLGDGVGHVVPERGAEGLPLDGEHAVALQVAEGAVVGDDVEAVVGALEGPTRAVPAVACGRPRRPAAIDRRSSSRAGPDPPQRPPAPGRSSVRVAAWPRGPSSSPSGSKSSRRHRRGRRLRRRLALAARATGAPTTSSVSCRGVGQVVGPRAAPVGEVDALEERRDDLAQLVEHQVGVGARLGQRVRRACAAAAARRPGRCRRCRRSTARRPAAGPRSASSALARIAWRYTKSESPAACGEALREPRLQLGQQLAVGVEHAVHVADVAGPERRVEDLGVAVVAVVAGAEPLVVGDVARRLLEVGHEPAPLEHLGEHVGRLLAGQVHATELGHRVVAVLDEDPLVELLGPRAARRWRRRRRRR